MSDEKFEPRGCPTPGACSAAGRIEALEAENKLLVDHYKGLYDTREAEMNKTDEFELGITEPARDELAARIESLEEAAEIEAALNSYHGPDGWDHGDRADMAEALAAADAVAPATARIAALEAALDMATVISKDWEYEANRWKDVATGRWSIDDIAQYQARIDALEAENTNLVKLRDGLVEILRAVNPYAKGGGDE